MPEPIEQVSDHGSEGDTGGCRARGGQSVRQQHGDRPADVAGIAALAQSGLLCQSVAAGIDAYADRTTTADGNFLSVTQRRGDLFVKAAFLKDDLIEKPRCGERSEDAKDHSSLIKVN